MRNQDEKTTGYQISDNKDGIRLDLNEDGEVQIIEEEHIEKNECFGGVMCQYCQIKKYEHHSSRPNVSPMQMQQMWCSHVNRSVIDIFYDDLARCPLNHWVKAAVPRYYEAVATPSPPPD